MTGLDLSRFRVGLPGAAPHNRVLDRRATCDLSAGDLYLFPSEGSNVTSGSAVTFKWDTTCLPAVTSVDLYLYTTSKGLLHSFPGVEYGKGEYNAGAFDPMWWNYTAKASVYLAIVDANSPRFLSSIPVGPTWQVYTAQDALSTTVVQGGTTAVVAASAVVASSKAAAKATASATNGTAAGAASDDPGMFSSSAIASPGGLPKGAIAAAIVVPLVAVAILVALYVKFARLREQEKRKRWSEAVDRRMSVISADWRQGAVASVYSQGGQGQGQRPGSMARSSVVSGGVRPTSTWTKNSSVYAVENNVAGRGANGFPGHQTRGSVTDRPASQLRPPSIFTVSNTDLATMPAGIRTSHVSFAGHPQARNSRVSFGDALGPSRSTLSINVPAPTAAAAAAASGRQNRMSRVDPSPSAGRHSIDGSQAMMRVSPTQAAGPFAVPAPPVQGRSRSGSSGGGVGGFFASITSAVGKRDKKPAAPQVTRDAEDWKQAEATRRSADGVRDVEARAIRRSRAISEYSMRSNGAGLASPSVYEEDDERVEELSAPAAGGMGMMGMPVPGATANPDQLLAAYAAARASAKSPTAGIGHSIEGAVDAAAAGMENEPDHDEESGVHGRK